ncbi:MAG: hypothetical protein GF331_24750, partial [Chitinivibrionales bacterium]|nr:hypothetical protein [Chitinivibrionales bacterium]
EGVMADQVNADWFMRQTTASPLLAPKRVRSALSAVLAHCSTPHGFVANCAWPAGGAVTIGRHTADQANWPWSGVEYSLAAHLVLAGKQREGLRVARDVWERYERAGLRFNHIECGGHYYRALSSWALYLALSGFAMDVPAGTITVAVDRKPAQFVLCTATGWGVATTGKGKGLLSLTVHDGSIRVRTFVLRGVSVSTAAAKIDGKRVACELKSSRGMTQVDFGRHRNLTKGTRLSIG